MLPLTQKITIVIQIAPTCTKSPSIEKVCGRIELLKHNNTCNFLFKIL